VPEAWKDHPSTLLFVRSTHRTTERHCSVGEIGALSSAGESRSGRTNGFECPAGVSALPSSLAGAAVAC